MKSFLVAIVFVMMQIITCYAEEKNTFKEIQIAEAFEQVLLSDPFLMTGAVDIKEIDGKQYVISVAMTTNEHQTTPTADARLTMLKIATLKAKAEIAKYIYEEISTSDTIEKTTEKETEREQERQKRSLRVNTILRESITTQIRDAVLRRVKRIGTWYSEDMSFYYVAVAMPIEE